VQASAARRLIERNPAFVEQALRTIESTSRRAVAELDHVLGLLRDDRPRQDASPTPDLGSLDGLLTAAHAGGLRVDQTVSGNVSSLPLLVSREAHRIVQEGLTNALKYSADGTAALKMALRENSFDVQLTNPIGGRRLSRADRDAGRGLRGIEERAAMLGGRARAHADGDRWTLSIELPVWETQQ
jgi:signal transduction histidine kinase